MLGLSKPKGTFSFTLSMNWKTIRRSVVIVFTLLLLAYGIAVARYGGLGKTASCPLTECQTPLIFAHRGHSQFPENSIAAFRAAIHEGYKGIELDIRLSKDGIPIVFHDANAERLLHKNCEVNSLLADDFRKLFLYQNDSVTALHPVLLEDVFIAFQKNTLYYLDIKIADKIMYEKVRDLILKHNLISHAIIASNAYEFLLRFKLNNSKFMVIQEDVNSRNQWTYHLIPNQLKPDFIGGSVLDMDPSHHEWLNKNNLTQSKIVYDVNLENTHLLQRWKLKHSIQDL
jgi:glycerophosphoryl diester phosphodiesterase